VPNPSLGIKHLSAMLVKQPHSSAFFASLKGDNQRAAPNTALQLTASRARSWLF